jgi:acetylornithine deacetylase/succinyl-diaminopimelate desuccinylase-like protein
VAAGVRRLGTLLTLPDVLRVLSATPAPRGRELAAATALRDWCAARWPDIAWAVEPYSDSGANLVASCGAGPLLYSHLDTSLDGEPADAAVTGRSDDPGPVRELPGAIEGFGLGVARGPAAAALLAFVAARRGTLLLAGSGTHRRGGRADGVLAYLKRHSAPSAAVVAKCGPVGVLWQEPGAGYLQVRVAGRYGAALAPSSALPSGGVAAHAGVLLDALARWRADHLAAAVPSGQVGAEAGVGALRAGRADKPDLLPAELVADLYLVTLPGMSLGAVADELTARLRRDLTGTPLGECELTVIAEPVHTAEATPPSAPIVRAACAAWTAEFGADPPAITGWTGSTDGVVFRAHGIDTVRLGPQSSRSPADPRRDVLQLADLEAFTRIYAALLRA